MLRVKLVKSPIGNTKRNRATIQALGLRKIRQVVEHEDSATVRGMVRNVKHLLEVEISDAPMAIKKKSMPAKGAAKNAKPTPTAPRKPLPVPVRAKEPAPMVAKKTKTPAATKPAAIPKKKEAASPKPRSKK